MMTSRTLVAAVCGAAMALTGGTATAVPDLNTANTFVKLEWIEQVQGTPGGGGVSKFRIGDYLGGLSSGILGSEGGFVYASCFEQDQYLRKGSAWYAVFNGVVDLPSSTGGITVDEQEVIRAIIGAKFGVDFTVPGNSTARDVDDVKALQSILWEAGVDSTDNLSDEIIGTKADDAGGKANAEGWLNDHYDDTIAFLDNANFVDLFAMVSVDLIAGVSDPGSATHFQIATGRSGQDFVTYEPGEGPVIPLPAPLVLFGVGLLGLYGVNHRRRS